MAVTKTGPAAGVIEWASVAGLAGIGAVHVAWGRGSTVPFATRAQLNDAVVGRDVTPSPAACYAVAAALFSAAALVAGATTTGGLLPRAGSGAVATVLAVRAGFGLAGRTDRLVPGSDSPHFRRLDRRAWAPLCAALAGGAASAALGRRA
jgi:hypothetical protein